MDPEFFRRSFSRSQGCIAGANNGRIDKFIGAIFRNKKLCVFQLDLNGIAGHDVGHLHTEYVGALLLEQGSVFAFFFSLLKSFSSFLLFLYLGFYHSVANGHFHSMYCGPG